MAPRGLFFTLGRVSTWSTLVCPLLVCPLLWSCSFLLDFEELEGSPPTTDDVTDEVSPDDAGPGPDETDETDDAPSDDSPTTPDDPTPVDDTPIDPVEAGTPGPDGTGDAAPEGGAASCAGGCDDGDPCTIDVCTDGGCEREPVVCVPSDSCSEAVCVDGSCVEAPLTGVVDDGYDYALAADTIYRSELLATRDRFFTATYGVWNGTPDIVITSFDAATGSPLKEFRIADRLPTNPAYVVISPAALVGDERISLTLNVYVAVRLAASPSLAGDVIRLQLTRDLSPIGSAVILGSSPNFRSVSPYVGPAAGQPDNGEPFVVWNGCTTTSTSDGPVCLSTEPAESTRGGLYIHSGGTALDVTAPGDMFMPESAPLSGLAPVTIGTTPGAIWMGNLDPSGVRVMTGFVGGEAPRELVQCNAEGGFTGYGLDAGRSRSDWWTVTWSQRSGSTSFFSEVTALQCSGMGCTDTVIAPPATTCPSPPPAGRLVPGTRAISVRTLQRPGDPSSRLYQCAGYAASDDESGSVYLLVNRVDYTAQDETGRILPSTPEKLSELVLASSKLTSAPDRPAIATMSPDRIAVSWLQPAASGTGNELHVQRYRICYGE